MNKTKEFFTFGFWVCGARFWNPYHFETARSRRPISRRDSPVKPARLGME